MSFNNETLLWLFDCYIGGIVDYASEIRVTRKKNFISNFANKCLVLKGVRAICVYAELDRVPLTSNRLYQFFDKILE